MRRTSLVEAKAHLSELVDAAEHRGRSAIILRHGKPAAAIVPVGVATARTKVLHKHRMSDREFSQLLDSIANDCDPRMTTEEALGRNRLDWIK